MQFVENVGWVPQVNIAYHVGVDGMSMPLVALSALLTTTMVQMKGIIQALQAAGVSAPVIVGGAPLTQEYASQIGARGYAPDAASAVDIVNKLLA